LLRVKRAIISDIHGNYEALTSVLADIDGQGVDDLYCLGDIIGYGPNPRECLDEIMKRATVTILGNHDQAALFDPDGFNPVALQAIYWTRDQLETSAGSPELIDKRWDFLGERPRAKTEGKLLFVHGSPREPTNEYVFPEDVYNQRKMDALFSRFDHYCFQGHTHIPGVFVESREFITPEECDMRYQLGDGKVMVNVGSVGQPRDGNSDSCYIIIHDETEIEFRRVGYSVDTTADKIYAVAELDNMLGDRLKSGR